MNEEQTAVLEAIHKSALENIVKDDQEWYSFLDNCGGDFQRFIIEVDTEGVKCVVSVDRNGNKRGWNNHQAFPILNKAFEAIKYNCRNRNNKEFSIRRVR